MSFHDPDSMARRIRELENECADLQYNNNSLANQLLDQVARSNVLQATINDLHVRLSDLMRDNARMTDNRHGEKRKHG